MFNDDMPASPNDAVREYTRWVGAENPDSAWILSPYDTWEPNPHYTGPANPRHPEDDNEREDEYEYTDSEGAVRTATVTPVRSLRELGIDPQDPCLVAPDDSDIPF